MRKRMTRYAPAYTEGKRMSAQETRPFSNTAAWALKKLREGKR
jgi:ribosomal protein S17